jgi:hypothetical protein
MTKLEELLTAIRGYEDPRRAGSEWKQVYKLLQKTNLPSANVTHIVGMRDVAGLAQLIDQLRAPPPAASPPDGEAPDEETCRRALRAFRKRLALTRLDDESRLGGHQALSRGEESRITAIAPPIDWPKAVWQELVRQGKLRYTGHGCYELAEE